jgi:hypothetical protein
MTQFFTRRAVLAMAASAATWKTAAASSASALRFRAIKVDVSALRANGDTITAQWLADSLPDLLQKAFADHLGPGDRLAPLLVARIDSVSYGPPGSAMQSMTSTHDFIEGAAVVDFGGRNQKTYPLMTFCNVGAALIDTPNGGQLRALALAGVFARFLPGQIGL